VYYLPFAKEGENNQTRGTGKNGEEKPGFFFSKNTNQFSFVLIRSVLFQPVLGITEKRTDSFCLFLYAFLLEEKEGGESKLPLIPGSTDQALLGKSR
jgi:hypothetical protein